jgi:heat shock protein HspQ
MDLEILQSIFNKPNSYNYNEVESPIEHTFLNHIIKFLDDNTDVIVQYSVNTISGVFRVDVVLKNANKVIAIECDGEEFHSKEENKYYDEWRDALIIIQKKVDVIYRIKGKDINHNIYALIYIIYQFDPTFFNEKYIKQIKSHEVHNSLCNKRIYHKYFNDENQSISSYTEVVRKNITPDFDHIWLRHVCLSLLYPNCSVYDLIAKASKYEISTIIEKLNKKYPKLKLEHEKDILNIF